MLGAEPRGVTESHFASTTPVTITGFVLVPVDLQKGEQIILLHFFDLYRSRTAAIRS
jgi:hypothetical protein